LNRNLMGEAKGNQKGTPAELRASGKGRCVKEKEKSVEQSKKKRKSLKEGGQKETGKKKKKRIVTRPIDPLKQL